MNLVTYILELRPPGGDLRWVSWILRTRFACLQEVFLAGRVLAVCEDEKNPETGALRWHAEFLRSEESAGWSAVVVKETRLERTAELMEEVREQGRLYGYEMVPPVPDDLPYV